MAKSLINYLTYRTNSGRGAIDARGNSRAGSMLVSLWPIKAANTLRMHQDGQVSD
jgi:hypothetical protein